MSILAGGRRPTPVDGVTVLTVYLVLLFAIPSKLTFAPLGGAGAPSTLLGLGSVIVWLVYRLSQSQTEAFIVRPVRRAVLIFVGALVASFVAAAIRPTNGAEMQSAQLSLLTAFGWLGVFLMTSDGVPSRARLDTLLTRLSAAAGLFAAFGLAQFFTGMTLTNYIVIPGLSANGTLSALGGRDGFNRPASTAIHPIEFGVTITALLPICLHVALHAKDVGTLRRWLPVAAIALAVPLSISRSAIVGAAIALLLLVPTWPNRLRLGALAALAALSGVVFVFLPGVIGTLTGLFAGAANDPSALSRTDSYSLAAQFITQAPVFGRGFGTFLPNYRILDNQYLLSTIETGIVGVGALIGVFLTSMICMLVVRRRMTNPKDRDLAQALFASIGSAAVGFSLFDGFAFPIFASFAFLVVGLCGALWRLHARPVDAWLRGPERRVSSLVTPGGDPSGWRRRGGFGILVGRARGLGQKGL